MNTRARTWIAARGNKQGPGWQTVKLDGTSELYIRTVDASIMRQMPESANTYIETSRLHTFLDRLRFFLRTGS